MRGWFARARAWWRGPACARCGGFHGPDWVDHLPCLVAAEEEARRARQAREDVERVPKRLLPP
jgi:hypothetical protein